MVYVVIGSNDIILDTFYFQVSHQGHRVDFIIQIVFGILDIDFKSIF